MSRHRPSSSLSSTITPSAKTPPVNSPPTGSHPSGTPSPTPVPTVTPSSRSRLSSVGGVWKNMYTRSGQATTCSLPGLYDQTAASAPNIVPSHSTRPHGASTTAPRFTIRAHILVTLEHAVTPRDLLTIHPRRQQRTSRIRHTRSPLLFLRQRFYRYSGSGERTKVRHHPVSRNLNSCATDMIFASLLTGAT